MSEALAKASAIQIPQIGEAIYGGYFAGIIVLIDVRYGLIVSPAEGGDLAPTEWGCDGTDIGASSCGDGQANTELMANAGSDLAKRIQALDLNGYTDWYLPARDELELAYRHLKPQDRDNWASFRDGDNPSSLPVGYPYTEQLPRQTAVMAFQEGGTEAFQPAFYWASTQYSAHLAWNQVFDDGLQGLDHKDDARRARAFRRFLID